MASEVEKIFQSHKSLLELMPDIHSTVRMLFSYDFSCVYIMLW